MQNQDQNKIYRIVKKLIPKSVISNKNKAKNWQYGYNDKYNVVVISKDGTIGDIYNINNLLVALPATPRLTSKEKKEQQVWNAKPIEKDLKKIQSIFHWHQTSPQFKAKWVDYIESEFDKREQGSWFLNNGTPTYITGTHYCNGLKLMLVIQILEKLIEYFIYFGRLAKLIQEVLVCVI